MPCDGVPAPADEPSGCTIRVPRAEWNDEAAAALRELFAMYKAARGGMCSRTVLKDDAGVLWQAHDGKQVLWSFKAQPAPDGGAVDVLNGAAAGPMLAAWRVYRLTSCAEVQPVPCFPDR
jgi:hypothetical protein